MESEPATAVVAAGEWGATEVAVGTADAVVVGGLSPWDGLSPVGDEDRSEDLVDDKDGPGGLVDDKDGHACNDCKACPGSGSSRLRTT